MRALLAFALLVVAFGSCGPSTRDIALAKTARYQAPKNVIYELVKRVTEKKHRLYHANEIEMAIYTKARWFTPSGLGAQWTDPGDIIGAGRFASANPLDSPGRPALPDKSLLIAMIIRVLPEAQNWIVYIETKIWRYNIGMPNLEPVDSKRIDLPGWATGKGDTLAYEIYNALRRYEVKGVKPPPEDPTPPPPAEPVTPAEPHPVDVPAINAGSDDGAGSGSGSGSDAGVGSGSGSPPP